MPNGTDKRICWIGTCVIYATSTKRLLLERHFPFFFLIFLITIFRKEIKRDKGRLHGKQIDTDRLYTRPNLTLFQYTQFPEPNFVIKYINSWSESGNKNSYRFHKCPLKIMGGIRAMENSSGIYLHVSSRLNKLYSFTDRLERQ